jgi:hypothetical protein
VQQTIQVLSMDESPMPDSSGSPKKA